MMVRADERQLQTLGSTALGGYSMTRQIISFHSKTVRCNVQYDYVHDPAKRDVRSLVAQVA